MEKVSSSSSSSASAAANNGGPDSFNGLKFGKKIYFDGHVGSGGGPAPPSPAKRLRAGFVQGSQRPRCQVEGCGVDLSDAKAYYSRHKVCGMHSKFAKVIVSGLEQRFCQQCSRFHLLPEFDEGKRSCRRRLAGHNERRRKPQQGSLLSPRHGTLFPTLFDNNHNHKTGGFVMDFSNYKPPSQTGRNLFPNSTSERGGLAMNHVAISAKSHLPLLSNQPNPLPDFLTSRPNYSCPVVSECFSGASDSNNDALSLLSNQAWGGPKGPLGLNSNFFSQPSETPSLAIGQFICPSWDFEGNNGDEPSGGLHGMLPDLCLGQAPNGGYNGGLGLGQLNDGGLHEMDESRGFGPSVQHVHWSL